MGHLIVLYDEMPMRRAQLVAFLSHWASLEHVELVTHDMPDPEDRLELYPDARMMVFSIGGVLLDRSPALHHIHRIDELQRPVPTVVLADVGSAHDAAIAFQAGAKGYIPASIEPDVALRALSFILHGGHFFPPSALLMPRSTGRGGGENNSSGPGSTFGRGYLIGRGTPHLQRPMAP